MLVKYQLTPEAYKLHCKAITPDERRSEKHSDLVMWMQMPPPPPPVAPVCSAPAVAMQANEVEALTDEEGRNLEAALSPGDEGRKSARIAGSPPANQGLSHTSPSKGRGQTIAAEAGSSTEAASSTTDRSVRSTSWSFPWLRP